MMQYRAHAVKPLLYGMSMLVMPGNTERLSEWSYLKSITIAESGSVKEAAHWLYWLKSFVFFLMPHSNP